jgi:hypothetical protein
MIARLNHRPMLVLALALATTVCVLLLLAALVFRAQPVQTTLPGPTQRLPPRARRYQRCSVHY